MKYLDEIANDAKRAWLKVMPNSSITTSIMVLGGREALYISLYIGKDKAEFINDIKENDPLAFSIRVSSDGSYEEFASSLYIKAPVGSYLAMGRVNMRKKSIKGITYDKLEKRFNMIRDMIIENVGNMGKLPYDINDKV